MDSKKIKPTKLLWVDLEMTGLNPREDVILEVAAIITDFNFHKLASYETCIKHPVKTVTELLDRNSWYNSYPANKKAFIDNLPNGKSLQEAEGYLMGLIKEYFGDEPAILAGNSIYNDRLFIKQWMPRLEQLLHYRMLDVSSWKIIMQGKFGKEFKKTEVHRALQDIEGSIAELKAYLAGYSHK